MDSGDVRYSLSEFYRFRVEDINHMKHENSYNVWTYYNNNEEIRQVVDSLRNGVWSSNPDEFRLIYNDLMLRNDEFFVLGDFMSYIQAQAEIDQKYRNRSQWARMMLINIAKSGYFSSDRTIQQYADEIWNLKPISFK